MLLCGVLAWLKLSQSFQDGEVSTEEFKKAIKDNCMGKLYAEFPGAFKAFIGELFQTIDIDGWYRVTTVI